MYRERESLRPRERVEIALNHQEPNRCPLQISFTPEFGRRLSSAMGFTLGFDSPAIRSDYSLERAVGCDLLLTYLGWAQAHNYQDQEPSPGSFYTDEWGVEWQAGEYKTRYGSGRYFRIVKHPLATENTEEALAFYVPPDPLYPGLYAPVERVIKQFKEEYFIVAGLAATIFETAWALRGFEQVLKDMVINPDLAERLFEIPFQYHWEAACRLVELGVDMILLADDVAGERQMLISPSMWRRFLKPRLAALIKKCKQLNSRLRIAYHSDGHVLPIIPDLIEIGVDVLNPVEPSCLDLERLKREYGDNLSFWGTVDHRITLTWKTPEEVEAEVVERLKTVGKGGGLIISPTHPVRVDTPLENFWAFVNAVHRHRYGNAG